MHHPLEAVTLPMENLKYDGGRFGALLGGEGGGGETRPDIDGGLGGGGGGRGSQTYQGQQRSCLCRGQYEKIPTIGRMRIAEIIKIDASASTIASNPSPKPLPIPITITILPPFPNTRRDQTNHRRLERTPVIIFVSVVLLLYPSLYPNLSLDAISNRTTSAKADIVTAEAKEAPRQHLGTTKPTPSLSSTTGTTCNHTYN